MKLFAVVFLVGLLVLAGVYVRVAPSDPARWHVSPQGATRDMATGVVRVAETGPDGLERLDRIARSAPRTHVLAGSVDEGMITYVTRSRVFGFPDYTTAQQVGGSLHIHGRLRFGRADFGVNRARVDGWLTRLQP